MCVKNNYDSISDYGIVILLFHSEGKSKKEKGAPIQRSTETGMAVELTRNMSRQPSRESNNGSMNSYNSEGKSVNHTLPVLITFYQLLLHPPHPSRLSFCFSMSPHISILLQCFCIIYIFPAVSKGKIYPVEATVA